VLRWTGHIALRQGGYGGSSLFFVNVNENRVGFERDTSQIGDFGSLSGGEEKSLAVCGFESGRDAN